MLHVAPVCIPCCMLVRVVRSCCIRLNTTANTYEITPNNTQQHATGVQMDATCNIQQCWGLLASEQYCVRLHGALSNRAFRLLTNGHSIFGLQLPTFLDVHTLLSKV